MYIINIRLCLLYLYFTLWVNMLQSRHHYGRMGWWQGYSRYNRSKELWTVPGVGLSSCQKVGCDQAG